MAIWSLIPAPIRKGLILAVTGGVIAAVAFGLGYYRGDANGVQRAAIQQLQADIKEERERARDDAKLRNLSDYDFCVQSLRRRGLQSADCEQLRGLASE
ncbi:MAG: hypothetical protein PBV01_11400 [Brucella anthropi]